MPRTARVLRSADLGSTLQYGRGVRGRRSGHTRELALHQVATNRGPTGRQLAVNYTASRSERAQTR